MKTLLTLLCVTMLIASCKQKTNLTTAEPNNFSIEHCQNNMQDTNELGIDCGWACEPCKEITPSCTPTLNTVKLNNSNYTMAVGKYAVSNGVCTMQLTNQTNTFKIVFAITKPSKYTKYKIKSTYASTVLQPDEVRFGFNTSGGFYYDTEVESGDLYFMEINGTYYATICNGETYNNFNVIG
ncbi:MAG: hypothetical protein ABL940_09665, partial [Bacteroidia bacterium]